VECGENRRFPHSFFLPGGADTEKKNAKAAILAALQNRLRFWRIALLTPSPGALYQWHSASQRPGQLAQVE